MGFFIQKTVKSILDQGKMATSYLVTSACFLLIACNVAAFIFFPKLMAPLAIILSNVVTVLLMLIAIRPINRLIQNAFSEKAQELVEKEKAEKQLLEKVATLENRNRELESRIDTWKQTESVPANVNFTFKLETMTFDKKGYIVKEEPLERFLNDPVYKLSDKKGIFDRIVKWVDDLAYPGQKRVLYIGKYYIKASIGLDFTKIKFSTDGGVLTLFGVTFSKLNDLAIDRDPGDVNRCMLVSEEWDGLTVNKSDFYQEFINTYSRIREEEADQALEGEVDALCSHYTAVFRSNLTERFPGIAFCDHIEDSEATWYSLKEHTRDARIYPIVSNMFLMADVLSGYIDASGMKLLND